MAAAAAVLELLDSAEFPRQFHTSNLNSFKQQQIQSSLTLSEALSEALRFLRFLLILLARVASVASGSSPSGHRATELGGHRWNIDRPTSTNVDPFVGTSLTAQPALSRVRCFSLSCCLCFLEALQAAKVSFSEFKICKMLRPLL